MCVCSVCVLIIYLYYYLRILSQSLEQVAEECNENILRQWRCS